MVAFEGYLPETVTPTHVRIEIVDWDFVDYPRIEILSDSESFRPHVDEHGRLCYLSPGAVVFDRQQPLENLKHCLAAAARELNRQVASAYRDDESRYEFVRYWSGGFYILLGAIRPTKRLHKAHTSFIRNQHIIIADDLEEIGKIRNAMLPGGMQQDHSARCIPAWVITLDVDPWLDRRGAPNTWRDLWTWIELVDSRAADCLRSVVGSREFAENDPAVILFRHESKVIGFHSSIPKNLRDTRSLAKLKRRAPSALAPCLRSHAGAHLPIQRFEVMEMGADFIHRRNLGMDSSLAGLKVHIVGAGAIGGFLAQHLSRLGAGASGGELRIIDPDTLGSENIGRHLLGIDALSHKKAVAVADFLSRQLPMSNIRGVVADARGVEDLFACDLLVDATGEEALSLVLNEMHQEYIASNSTAPPMLFAWVLGNGEVVQCLLSDGGDHACYDCLHLPLRDGLDRHRFPVLKQLPETKAIGCHTMRPYAIAAPTAAAALASQMIADWKHGHSAPRFRTLYLGRGDHLFNIRGEADPKRLTRCATCSRI